MNSSIQRYQRASRSSKSTGVRWTGRSRRTEELNTYFAGRERIDGNGIGVPAKCGEALATI